jgi:glycosyltransferase involved in cell wall biosynthesis
VLGADEHARAVGTSADAAARRQVDEVVVPWRGTYLLPELVTEQARYTRLAALARFSGNRTGAVGFDAVPVTSAETTAEAMGSAYAGQLAALRHFDVVAPISHAAGEEFAGWARMCRAAGRTAPEVRVVPLAKEASSCTAETRAEVARRLTYGADLPLVLVVGSHEPRKNHRALLHAAERLWRDGLQFSLLFVGGNAWRSEGFVNDLEQLQRDGRLVDSVRGLPDDELWALYQLAWCTAFPSLNEGFGLPVAESLAAGTPVLTSRFGSMKEIAETGGALLVDPRDDDSITEGLRSLLTDRAVHDVLRGATAGFPVRSWQQYAEELWVALTDETAGGPARRV